MSKRWVIALVVVVLLGLLAVVDRVAVGQVEDRVAQELRTQLSLSRDPTVEIDGIPFLTQVVSNRFGNVRLSGRGLPAGTPERPLEVDRLELDLRGVRTGDGLQRITADEVAGSASVTWAEISDQVGAAVTPQNDGRVRVDITADLYGQHVPFVISARPVLDVETQQVHLNEPRVTVATYRIPDEVVERIVEESVPPVELNLPLGLRASDLRVGSSHLELGLSGTDLVLVG